ncbi:hypothetical protein ACJX0J_030257 [Zea mays]
MITDILMGMFFFTFVNGDFYWTNLALLEVEGTVGRDLRADFFWLIPLTFSINEVHDMATVIVQEGITIFVVLYFLFLYITRTYEAALHLSNDVIPTPTSFLCDYIMTIQDATILEFDCQDTTGIVKCE